MPETRIPDPTLMARLQLSVTGIDWAASLVAPWQHESVEGEWPPNAQLWHLLAVERENFQPRIKAVLSEDRPALQRWDSEGRLADERPAVDIQEYAAQFMVEREKTVALLTGLTPEQWQRTGTWPDGNEVDLAWVAEKVLWHGLDHFALLLDLHQEYDHRHARRWTGST
ncbi:MAG: DinB family protein [Dehalococcoidia bacterium]